MAFLKDEALNISHFIDHIAIFHCMLHRLCLNGLKYPWRNCVYPIFWDVHVIISGYQ